MDRDAALSAACERLKAECARLRALVAGFEKHFEDDVHENAHAALTSVIRGLREESANFREESAKLRERLDRKSMRAT